MIDPKLADKLPRLSMENLGRMDNGSVARRVDAQIGNILRNISQFPYRDAGKPETRKLTIEVQITPELRPETNGNGLITGYELCGLSVRAKIKAGLPDAESADVRMLCDVRGGEIRDVLFNPDNNTAPEQLELEFQE